MHTLLFILPQDGLSRPEKKDIAPAVPDYLQAGGVNRVDQIL
jgi:hypothetical protein